MVGAKRQKLVIGVAAALMMLLGASLAWAGGLTETSGGSLPTIVASDRPVTAVVTSTSVEVQPSENTTKAPRIAAKRATVSVTKTNASSIVIRKKSSSASSSSSTKDDERETVKPPVRDEDDDDDDDNDDEHQKDKKSDSSHGD